MEVMYSKYMYGHKWGYMGGSLALVIFASDSASYFHKAAYWTEDLARIS